MVTQKKSKNKSTSKIFSKFGDFAVIPLKDREQVKALGLGLQSYWLDCWAADPFGSRWVELEDDPENTTQSKYRKQLEELGLFLFEKIGNRGNWRIRCINLHGSRAHLGKKYVNAYYGMPNAQEEQPITYESVAQNQPQTADFLDHIESKNPETPINQTKNEPSISPQELHIGVLEGDNIEDPTPAVWILRDVFETIEAGEREPDAETLDECYQDVALQSRIAHLIRRNPQWELTIKYGKVISKQEADKDEEPGFIKACKAVINDLRSRLKAQRLARWENLKHI